ncbi:MAG: TetR/AcrR family transcriptional regulator [Deltaproteobacteria bacterium]|nr:TetR/AcrR family transcriptional regulator [Deltaproteobacteria bacterium]
MSQASNKNKRKRRVSSNERRQQLIEAALPLFAQVGFRGVTTRQLATTAGVSEALLYQHFPSKEELYSAVQDHCCQPREELKTVLSGLEPSTATLVELLYFQTKMVIDKAVMGGSGGNQIFPRLMMHSVLEDGEFARLYLQRAVSRMAATMQRSVIAAKQAGDIPAEGVPDDLADEMRFWFCHHLLVTVLMYRLTPDPVVAYPVTEDQLQQQIVLFMLKGIGLTEAAIAKYCNFSSLRDQTEHWFNLIRDPLVESEGSDP